MLLDRSTADEVADHDKPGGDPDAHLQGTGGGGLKLRRLLDQLKPGADGALGVMLVGMQLIVNLSEEINVDVIDLEGVGILAKADRLQPFPDLAHALSCSSSALASSRSSVSKPSLNQP